MTTIYKSASMKDALIREMNAAIESINSNYCVSLEDGEFGGNHKVMLYEVANHGGMIFLFSDSAKTGWELRTQHPETCKETTIQTWKTLNLKEMAAKIVECAALPL